MGINITNRLSSDVINAGICSGCGACVALAREGDAKMVNTESGVEPVFATGCELPELAWQACPGKGIDYPDLYKRHYGQLPEDWRIGKVNQMWTGYATDEHVRSHGASGGVTSEVLIYLLETGRIDGAIIVQQGNPAPEYASWIIARTREDVLNCAQSVYVPVSVIDALPHLVAGERYAMTCVPEQSAALRVLQQAGEARANQINYVLGPYTGTALDRRAIRSLLRANGVKSHDAITSLEWRAGEWPGYLQITTDSGKVIRSKKVYYNYLIPFFVTQSSLQSMDFSNEFTDLSVGDAWSPKFEAIGRGFSVVTARNEEMSEILGEMQSNGRLDLEQVDPIAASEMHGHMIDFKKRGSYLRNRWRVATFRKAPDYGLDPQPITLSRIIVELVISMLFLICRNSFARWCMEQIPERILGPLFNRLRLMWKSLSKPSKRRGLSDLTMQTRVPDWKLSQA